MKKIDGCICSFSQRMVGDGCRYCNPQYYTRPTTGGRGMKIETVFMIHLITACYSWCIAAVLSFIWITPMEKNVDFIVWTGIFAWLIISVYSFYRIIKAGKNE